MNFKKKERNCIFLNSITNRCILCHQVKHPSQWPQFRTSSLWRTRKQVNFSTSKLPTSRFQTISSAHYFRFTISECIVLVPKSKTANSTTLLLERRLNKVANDNNNGGKNNVHVAGGEHHGIIVYKTLSHGITSCIVLFVLIFCFVFIRYWRNVFHNYSKHFL